MFFFILLLLWFFLFSLLLYLFSNVDVETNPEVTRRTTNKPRKH